MAKKIILAFMAIVALAAVVLPAGASASPRLCETTADHITCDNIGNVNVEAHNVGNLIFTNASGPITCSSAVMTGTITENTGTAVRGTISSASFGGTGTNGDCTGPLGTSIAVIVNEGNGLPWCLSATNAMEPDEFQVRGNSCGNAARSITFRFNITGLNDCKYNRPAGEPVVGTFTTDNSGTTSEDAILSFTEQAWNLEEETKTSIFAPACPSSGKLDGSMTLETDVPETSPLFIK